MPSFYRPLVVRISGQHAVERSRYDRLHNDKSLAHCGPASHQPRPHTRPRDAMDREAVAVQYHGCLIVDLYNEARPHMALGPGVPDPPPAAVQPATQLPVIKSAGAWCCASNRYWAACITNIRSRPNWPDRIFAEHRGGPNQVANTFPTTSCSRLEESCLNTSIS